MSALIIVVCLIAGLYALGRMMTLRVETQHPPVGSFVNVDGLKFHYIDGGVPQNETDPVIVLIHGASGTLNDFRHKIFLELAKTHRVIAFDRPGHGYSERPKGQWPNPEIQADLIHKAIHKLGVDKPIIVGHSWGGAVAAAYGLAFADDVRAVVLLSAALYPWEGETALYQRICAMPVVGWMFVHLVVPFLGPKFAEDGAKVCFDPEPMPEDYTDQSGVALLFRPDHFRANAEDMRNLKSYLVVQSKQYPDFKPPLTIVTGNRDQVVFAKLHSYQMHEAAPHSKLVKLEGGGHMPHHVHMSYVAKLICQSPT